METAKKCLNPTCSCPALPLLDYCCDGCQLAASDPEPEKGCQCHHPDCGGEIELPPDGLLIASEVLASA